MKGKSNRSDNKNVEHMFKQLDRCISEARKAEQSNSWEDAWQEANKLDSLTKCSCTVQIVANSAAALSGVYRKDWILFAVSVAAVFGFVIVLYGNRHKK